jgi:hypothetical protein
VDGKLVATPTRPTTPTDTSMAYPTASSAVTEKPRP